MNKYNFFEIIGYIDDNGIFKKNDNYRTVVLEVKEENIKGYSYYSFTRYIINGDCQIFDENHKIVKIKNLSQFFTSKISNKELNSDEMERYISYFNEMQKKKTI